MFWAAATTRRRSRSTFSTSPSKVPGLNQSVPSNPPAARGRKRPMPGHTRARAAVTPSAPDGRPTQP
eukprot:3270632-Lingulodinium_polyedra.AAC.1